MNDDDDDSDDDKNTDKYACFRSEDTVFNDGKAQTHRNIYIGMSCPKWQQHRTGYYWSPV